MASNWYKTFMASAGVEVGSHKPDKPTRYTGPPMDLANMRANGVRSLLASCLDCYHDATVNVDHLPGHLAVPSFAKRMNCSRCGSKSVDVRPAWGTKTTDMPR
jgi:hypothetical protein